MVCSVSVTLMMSSSVLRGDDEEKVVRLIWFPRFSPDGKTLLTAHGHWDRKDGGEARLFDAKEGKVLKTFKEDRGVRSVAWSSKGEFIVTGSYGGEVHTYDVKSGKELNAFPNTNNAENVRLSADDKMLVVSYGSGDLRIYDLPDYKLRMNFKAVHKGGIWGLALSPNDQYIASAGKDTFVNIIDVKKNKVIQRLKHPGETNGVVFTRDNKYVLTGCEDSLIRVFDVETGEEHATYKGYGGGPATDLQFTSDGKTLVSSLFDGKVLIWDTTDVKNASLKKTLRAHTAPAFGVAISPDDLNVASVGWDDKVRMWDLKTGEPVWTWQRK
jgi:WD40 repeat protein